MSHLALYRKYRPQNFDEVFGQESVVSQLQTIVSSSRVPHALLLVGSRGIGKTTLARIFGKSLGIDAHDIYEIDAASYRKVENMRELINDVLTLPVSSPYKMYILDEVHMLTSESFNTLLKTLEEPPAHVIFVLATTELHKVLSTVVSRCQVFHLKKPTVSVIADQVVFVANKEGITVPQELALVIAERANGSFRDALVLLDQVIGHSKNTTITADDIAKIGLREIDSSVFSFLDEWKPGNTDILIGILHRELDRDQKRTIEFIEKLILVMRFVLYVHHAKTLWSEQVSDLANDQVQKIQSWADEKRITPELLIKMLAVYEETKKSTIPTIPLELAIIEILGNTTKA